MRIAKMPNGQALKNNHTENENGQTIALSILTLGDRDLLRIWNLVFEFT